MSLGRCLVIASLLLCSCRSLWFEAPAPRVSGQTHPLAEAIVLADHGALRFLSSSSPNEGYELTVRRRVQVVTPGGRFASRIAVPVDGWSRLTQVGARSYDAEAARTGRIENLIQTRIAPSELTYVPVADDAILYSDARVALFDVPGAQPGRIIEYHYTIESQQGFGLPVWTFDGPLPVVSSRFEVEVPSGWTIQWGLGGEGVALEPTPTDEGLLWQLEDLPAIKKESLSPPMRRLVRRLQLTVQRTSPEKPARDWHSVARSYLDLTRGLAEPPEEAARTLDNFSSRSPGESDAERVFRFVRDRIRYVAIERGIGTFKPHSAAHVWRTRWGDCKDKVTLALSLYRRYGMTAMPVLVSTRSWDLLHRDVPTISAFDHVILALRSDDGVLQFLDPTARHTPFHTLPWEVQGQRALVVHPDGRGELVTLPVAPAAANRMVASWRVSDQDVTLTVEMSGQVARRWRRLRDGPQRRLHHAVRQRFLADFADHQIVDVQLEGGETMRLGVTLSGQTAQQLPDGLQVLRLEPFVGVLPELRVPTERRWDISLGYPWHAVTHVIFELAEGHTLKHAPRDASLQLPFGRYELIVESSNTAVTLMQSLVTEQEIVSREALSQLRELHEMMTHHGREALVIQ